MDRRQLREQKKSSSNHRLASFLGIGVGQVRLLERVGFDTLKKVRRATDEQLLAVTGIGQQTLDRIRSAR